MYESINSDLINSYAWDTALVFIELCGTNNNYANFPGNGTLRATGGNSDEQCKICDMAENVQEFTTETCIGSGSACTIRGAYWNGSAYIYRPNNRSATSSSGKSSNFGFRSILYL